VEKIPVTEQNAKEIKEWARQVNRPLFLYARACRIPVHDARDIVQEVFSDVCAREEPLPVPIEERNAILFKIAKLRVRAYFTERRRNGERAALAREHATIAGMTYERDSSGVLEARQQLQIVLPEISDEQYEVFTTKVLDGLKVCEVAAKLDMNPNTARRYLSLALETLRAKLESLDHRGVRGLVILLAISSVLALADVASAMIGRLKRFFLAANHVALRGVASAATVAAIVLLPPNSGASADNLANADKRGPSPTATNTIMTPETPRLSIMPDKLAPGNARDSTSPMLAPGTLPQKATPKKVAVKVAPPDHLLGMAMRALQSGNPEKTIELLDQYPVQDLKWADALRAQAKAALMAKKPAAH
jgi:DNA-directed RNA polymerase specialized sigma24 family protein